ncbi:UDP-glucose 4-epimerase [Candidatus Uhrbacteria bacterium RIFCSPHIGHO2_12_FULL_54_23]|uniref:UDP-glucose 4-epimerase n=3 Tax=Candidatus Uhriibacteriota TaxID=1752732 RepID=A0A1F7UPP4_9BACT|nr:MAG: UDP-glucose 4-epimerase [Candidatus Uhrbacteria bacterium RIFCSPHIGHO2_12_FULL_54_23]OGL85623.1 MAG: UDP-glucose 4-epimerase [Candidatus Uhrbacteria bacterium RIFCSPLOWO2_01_FULL_55_36]OGL91133.1 MAG: UDP-glucose 4-epimerase [Candidatus Uhrbacteria bacterium RIFCSPLOWO2_02_FULL_54_37]
MANAIIVTGGAGFIGSHIVDALIAMGHRVWVVDNLSTGRRENINLGAKFIRLDIRSPKLRALFLKIKPDFVFHLAAQLDVRMSLKNPLYDAEVNILGSLNVIQACLGAKIKKIVFTSSGGAVYGDVRRIPTPETESERPISPYGAAKLAVDTYLHQYWVVNRLHYTSLRFGNVYGPRQNPYGEAGVIAIFAGRLARGQSCAINGTGAQTRDFVYVGDVVEAALRAMRKPFVGVVNIATGKESSVNQVYAYLARSVGTKLKAQHNPAIRGEQMRSVLDWRKAKRVLGWRPKVSLEEGIERTVEWHRGMQELNLKNQNGK